MANFMMICSVLDLVVKLTFRASLLANLKLDVVKLGLEGCCPCL